MKVKVSYSPTVSDVNEIDLTVDNTTRGEWIIGRSPDSDLVLDSPDVSRIHAKFFVKTGSYYFSDLGSRNGSIINNKPAEKERPYVLNDGDVIRIADYVLIIEAVAPLAEQLPETVFRIIDPSLFSRPRPENVSSSPNVASSVPEVVSEPPAPVSETAPEVSPISSEVETPVIHQTSPEISEVPEKDVTPVAEAIVSENIIQPQAAVNEVPVAVNDQIVDEATPVVSEVETPVVANGSIPEVSTTSEVSLTEPDDVTPTAEAITPSENIVQTPDEESAAVEATDDEIADLETALSAEATFVQPRDLISPETEAERAIPQSIDDELADLEAELAAETTSVQPRDIFRQETESDRVIPQVTHDELADLEAQLTAETTSVQPRDIFRQETESDRVIPVPSENEVADSQAEPIAETETSSQETEEESPVSEATPEQVEDLDTSVAAEVSTEVEGENANVAPKAQTEVAEDVTPEVAENVTPEIADVDTSDVAAHSTEVETADTQIKATVDTSDVAAHSTEVETAETKTEATEASETQEDAAKVFSNQYIDFSNRSTVEASDVESPEQVSETTEELSQAEVAESDEISAETNDHDSPAMPNLRNIVLIAHESKKSELAEFAAQHQEFFSESFTITWPSVSEVLRQKAGITVSQEIPAAISGGYQTIAASVGSGEILAVIFFRDLLQPQPGQANEEALLRLCNINQVLFATNLPTAEAVVHYVKHITS